MQDVDFCHPSTLLVQQSTYPSERVVMADLPYSVLAYVRFASVIAAVTKTAIPAEVVDVVETSLLLLHDYTWAN